MPFKPVKLANINEGNILLLVRRSASIFGIAGRAENGEAEGWAATK